MYYNHNLRTNLQEWKSRLYKANYEQFGHQLKYCLSNIENNKLLKSLINDAVIKYKYDKLRLENVLENYNYKGRQMDFENETQHSSFCYQFVNYVIEYLKTTNNNKIHDLIIFHDGSFEETKKYIIEQFITPIFYYFNDRLEKSNSVIYLLEKYKRRTEWFTDKQLLNLYNTSNKNYEQIFEDDLRLFLFDQGIDYPFSTPKSTSGRADIIGSIETSDPLIIEIKIFDRQTGYGKDRIIGGFSQIIKYTNDYNKDIGYLVVFNTDKAEIDYSFKENNNFFPPMLTLNNKTYFFITVNLNRENSASKVGKSEIITITEDELTI